MAYLTVFKECFTKGVHMEPPSGDSFFMYGPTEYDWSKFLNLLGISNSSSHQQQLSSGKPEFEEEEVDKLYVLTRFLSFQNELSNVDIYGHSIYRIDHVNSACPSPDKPLEPIFNWYKFDDTYQYGAYLILGSKLYMFGGINSDHEWLKSMLIYDLEGVGDLSSSRDLSSFRNLPPPVVSGRDMNRSKSYPVAVAIGHSKICVFSTLLDSPTCFELFDIENNTWKILTDPVEYDDTLTINIISYCVHQSCLIIQTNIYGFYGINVDNTSPEWVKLVKSEKLSFFFPFEEMWSMVDDKLCGPFNVMKRGHPSYYPFSPKADRESLIELQPKGVLFRGGGGVDDDRRIDLCLVRTGFPLANDMNTSPTILIDIIKFDHEARNKFGKDLSKWKEFETHKSITFSLKPSHRYVLFEVVACFPIKIKMDALESRAHSNKCFASSHTVGTEDIPFDVNTQGGIQKKKKSS